MIQLKGPISKTYLAESVYQTLLENILSGTLTSGTEISEVGLATQLQVSRTPVHEAIARLINDGLVVQGPTRRLTVARFSSKEIRDIYDIRVMLECAAAERAARKITRADLDDLKAQANLLEKDMGKPDWPSRALEFDLTFHDILARSAGNDRLRDEISRYRLLVRAFCRITASGNNLEQAFREHVKILKALEAGDAAGASRAMKEHVQSRLKTVIEEFYPEGS